MAILQHYQIGYAERWLCNTSGKLAVNCFAFFNPKLHSWLKGKEVWKTYLHLRPSRKKLFSGSCQRANKEEPNIWMSSARGRNIKGPSDPKLCFPSAVLELKFCHCICMPETLVYYALKSCVQCNVCSICTARVIGLHTMTLLKRDTATAGSRKLSPFH